MAFKIAGGSFYPPLTYAHRIAARTSVVPTVIASTLRYTASQPGQLSFAASSYSGVEETVISFAVTRASGANGTIAVDWAITGLTDGVTVPSSGTISWNNSEAGNKSVNVLLPPVTQNRTGTITLSNPRSVSGGAAPTITGGATRSITVTDNPNQVTVTYNVATESAAGQDGAIQWQSVFLINDGRIVSFGTGNHAPEQSNAMRCIDPVTVPGSVSSYDIFPHSQSGGVNTHVYNYDNHPSIYMPSENKALWAGHGVFDFAATPPTWTYGDRAPNTQLYTAFLDTAANPLINETYNPAVAWCSALDKGVWFGQSAGGSGQTNDEIALIERTTSGTKPWRVTRTDIGAFGAVGISYGRNGAVCVGKFFYCVARRSSDNSTPIFQRIDLETFATVTLALPPLVSADYFPQLVYDSDRKKLVLIGVGLHEYDLDTNTWTTVTPSGWPGYQSPMGVYHPQLKAIYFRGIPHPVDLSTVVQNFRWHKIVFPQTVSRWALVSTDTNASPFQGEPEEEYGGSKHVWMTWVPNKGRVYTFGGDYGSGADQFGQPNMGAGFTTNAPSGARSYTRDSSLNNDQYSINPYATGTVPWRLEHPYLPRNLGGNREVRPGRPDQVSLVWDPVRSKLWAFQNVIRTEFLYRNADNSPDLWANGDMTTSGTIEPLGTYSFVPGVNGSPGTWTMDTSNRLSYRQGSGTSYNGGQLITGIGDERVGLFQYEKKNDVIACLSSSNGGGQALFTFHPGTLTYQYRTFFAPGYTRMDISCSQCDFVDGWAYAVGLATQTNGVRKSVLIRVNVTAALAVANAGSVPSSAIEVIDLPWSLSTNNEWENLAQQNHKWQEHCGVLAIDRKIVLVKGYDGLIENGITKLAIWDPDSRRWTAGQVPPEALHANSWCVLPDTGEVFMGLNTSFGDYSNLRMWRYRVR